MEILKKLVDIEYLREITTYGNHSIGMLLYSIASSNQCKNIMEIGYFHGYSAVMLCAGAVDGNKNSTDNLCVISIDINYCDGGEAVKKQPFGNIHHFILGDSKECSDIVRCKFKNQKIDLLFIDGEHSYEACHNEWMTYKDMLSDTAIIAFHDNYDKGIQKVIDEIEEWNFINLNGWGCLTVGSHNKYIKLI